jgi:predicted secreted Zn-dependent protease
VCIFPWRVHTGYRHKIKKTLCLKISQVETISDAYGLNVRLSTSGSITFFYRDRWDGKAAQLTIGDYPTTSLSHVRERRQQSRAWLTKALIQDVRPYWRNRKLSDEEIKIIWNALLGMKKR